MLERRRKEPPSRRGRAAKVGRYLLMGLLLAGALEVAGVSFADTTARKPRRFDAVIETNSEKLFRKGQRVFRHSTFASEGFFGDALQLHKAVVGEKFGGVGAGVSPETALAVGLKVDSEALPGSVKKALAAGEVDLKDPATTVALLQMDAVVGVKAHFDEDGDATSMGVTCALCHSDVDDSFAPGIGRRLDGWPNRDLDVGTILSLSPNLEPVADYLHTDVDTVKTVLTSWGPGKFDAGLFLDGKAFRPDGSSAATLLPPAYGLAGVNLHTFTGFGSVPYWNAFVGNLEMHGKGNFYDPRLDDAEQFPLAAEYRLGHVTASPSEDVITKHLPALQFYQLAIPAPKPPAGSFDAEAAARGKVVFNSKAQCATCHVPPLFTEPGHNIHPPSDIGIDSFQADRSPEHGYRTTPLKGLWSHTKGGFYHDGRFETVRDVVDHYDSFMDLGLTESEKEDLVQYLMSI
ncbi:MAG TPA: hypothetical protein VG318_12230 [Actinomycetota bacterium]|nr:hypothetical protein [Actinomycetota bacterium]